MSTSLSALSGQYTMKRLARRNDLFEFVKLKHGDQKRKYTGDPYYTHLEVVAELASHYEHSYPFVYEVALCHDLFEDTSCTFEDLKPFLLSIGYADVDANVISYAVADLTDVYTTVRFPGMNRKARKMKEAIRLGRVDSWVQSIKYADLIDNTKSIVQYDPNFAKIYLEEKRFLLSKMRDGNIDLFVECCYLLRMHSGEVDLSRVRTLRTY